MAQNPDLPSTEYPDIVYRPGSTEQAWGVMVDTLRVADKDEKDAALADGWFLTPAFDDPKAKAKADKA